MLQGRSMHPTIPTSDLKRARAWYADKPGLTPDQELPGGFLYRTGGDGWFLLLPSSGAGTSTPWLAGWWRTWRPRRRSCATAAWRSRTRICQGFDLPGLRTVDGVATTPAGKAAWFTDSDGNLLGLIEGNEAAAPLARAR